MPTARERGPVAVRHALKKHKWATEPTARKARQVLADLYAALSDGDGGWAVTQQWIHDALDVYFNGGEDDPKGSVAALAAGLRAHAARSRAAKRSARARA